MRSTSVGRVPPLVSQSTMTSAPADAAARSTSRLKPALCLVAVEEVLGVEEHPPPLAAEEGDRVGHHVDGLGERRAQGVDHVALGRLGDQAHRARLGLEQIGQHRVGLGPAAGLAGRSERHQHGVVQMELTGRRPAEELLVLRIGSRPAALDELHPEMVELLGHPQLVVHRERQPFLLAAVAQGGVVDVDRFGQGPDDGGGGDVDVVTRHVRASPCTGRPDPGPPRGRPLGSAG